MKSKERTVQFYEFTMDTISADGRLASPNQDDFLTLLTPIASFLKSGHEIGKGASLVELVDYFFNPSDGSLEMLINKVDPDLPDVAYRNRKNKSRRPGSKLSTEDIELSAHAILTPSISGKTAVLKLTTGAGVSPNRVSLLLNSVYREQKSDNSISQHRYQSLISSAKTASGKPILYEVNHRFDYTTLPSTALKEIIRTGVITGVELIDSGVEIFDSSKTPKTDAEINRKTIGVYLKSSPKSTGFFKTLVDVAKSSHDIDVDALRIDYKDESGENRHKVLEANKLDAAFTKSSKITLENEHPPRQTKISKEIVDAMRQLG